MTHFIKNGNTFNIADDGALDIRQHLPGGNYVVKFDERRDVFFLETMESFVMPKKIYGDSTKNRDRIFNTFQDRESSTGVLLVGEKGSGKTLLTKSLCILAAENNIPTLIINTAFHGDDFNKFIQSIEQPCVIVLDEFDKTYDDKEQESLLTLLDGVFPSKKLFLLTANGGNIDKHMKNRPGRIFYHIEYEGVDSEFIREYCEDNLLNKSHIDTIVDIFSCFGSPNFDMVQALVQEMNRYNETPQQAMNLLNAKLKNDSGAVSYFVDVFVDGKPVKNTVSPSSIKSSPLSYSAHNKPYIHVYESGKADDIEGDEEKAKVDFFHDSPAFQLNDENLLKVEKGGTMVYKQKYNDRQIMIMLTRSSPPRGFNFDAF